ncbi:GUN4 domain-containing protein [Microcoleus sp. A2-C5]
MEVELEHGRGILFSRVVTCNLVVDYNEKSSQSSSIISKCSNSVSTSIAAKESSQSTVSPPPTNVSLTIPISADVPLKSKRGVDYTQLRYLLASGQWKKADEETANKMVEVAGRREDGWLRFEDIDRFPCEDLRTIDQLWVKYSNGHFGFSVQKRIYESLGGTREEYDDKILQAFADRVGWRVKTKWLSFYDLKFNIKAPEGHLPVGVVWSVRWWRFGGAFGGLSSIASRLVKCNI